MRYFFVHRQSFIVFVGSHVDNTNTNRSTSQYHTALRHRIKFSWKPCDFSLINACTLICVLILVYKAKNIFSYICLVGYATRSALLYERKPDCCTLLFQHPKTVLACHRAPSQHVVDRHRLKQADCVRCSVTFLRIVSVSAESGDEIHVSSHS